MILLLLAAAVVYQSSPQQRLSAQGSSAGSDQLYVIANVGVGARLYQVADDGSYTAGGFVTSPDCTFDRFYGMDTAPDGTVYAMARCYSGDGDFWYGRFDPESAKFTPLHQMQSAALDYYDRFNITFPAQFGAPGTPIGYRTRYNNGVGTAFYAVDAIAPYREHLVNGAISPPLANISIGAAMSQDGSALFPVSAVETFRLELQPVPADAVTSAVTYGGFGIGNAVVSGIDATGYFSIFDGEWRRMIKPTAPTAVNPGVKLIGLTPITGAFLRRAPLGGVRIEPHRELTTSESGATATFTAVLTAQPTADVTVSFTSSDTSEGTVSPASATFTAGDWNTPQTITVTGALDNDGADQTFSIVTAATSADANYNGRGVLDVDVTNTEVNQLPALAPGSPVAQQGSASVEAILGTVSDFETAAGSLTVDAITVPATVTVGTITNTAGTISAPVSASCIATPGANTLTLRVSDDYGESIDQDVTVTVYANSAPILGTYTASLVIPGGSTTVNPDAAPADNGFLSSVDVSSPGFTGSLSVNASTGIVSVGNAGPAGVHTVTITATDNCGAISTRTFDLMVNGPPTATAVTITGTLLVGELLTGNYTFSDPESNTEGTSTFRWLRGGVAIDGATATTYTTVVADSGQVLTFEVTPISVIGTTTGAPATSAGDTILNSAPTATAVTITGTLLVGEVLTGGYTFADVDNDAQGTSTFRWLRGGAPIDDATALTYTTVAADSGQLLTFEVTPTAATGIATGIAATSAVTTILNSAPAATAVTIIGTLRVGELLTGAYIFADLDDDAHGATTFRWLRGGVAIDDATAITYTTVAADSGQVLTFEVTPIAETGITTGAAATSSGATILNSGPTASAVSISGTSLVGHVLTGAYTFDDLDNDAEGTSTFRWLRAGVPINSATAITYTTVAADSGQILTFEVTPQSTIGVATGAAATSAGVTIQNSAPTATAIGTTQAGFVLTGAYTFADIDGDAEGTSTFRWLRGGGAIPGATANSYTLTGADVGATIAFEVTPIAATGVLAGNPATSTGVVIASIAPAISQDPVSALFAIDATATFTAAASGLPAPTVKWQVSIDAGATFTDLPGATDVVYTRIVALTDHGTKFRAVFSNIAGDATTAAATLTVPGPAATLPTALIFGASANGATIQSVTPAQAVRVMFGGESFAWTAVSNQPWLQITSGNGTGRGTFTAQVIAGAMPAGATTLSATITVTATGATNSPLAVPVTLTVARIPSAPIGVFETPANGATVEGSIAVTGWALDDVAVDRVEIWRDLVAGESTPPHGGPGPGTGKVFIANAFFVAGARPDVAVAYAVLPQADRAGWGYLLLTYGLWNRGNGPFTLYAIAYDHDGRSTVLGSKNITATNATAVRPFGALDTPAYGETVTGSFWNFGWALTPNAMPTCTIEPTGVFMSIDSGPLSAVNYGDFRADIAAAFPGFSNAAGAGGAYYVDTSTLADGIHQIGWYVVDNCGRAEGMGSRFFTVQNGSADAPAASRPMPAATTSIADASSITVRRGQTATTVAVNSAGSHRVAIAQGERVEIVLPGVTAGYQRVNGEQRALPVGSTLDDAAGVFYWEPGASFLGAHDLEFIASIGSVVRVRAIVGTAVQAVIDTPHADDAGNLPADASFTIAGWAIDEAAAQGTGIDAVHVWAHSTAGGDPIFLGVADYGDSRPDIAALFGEQFSSASYRLAVDGLSPGEYDVVVYPHSAVTGDFHGAQMVRLTVR